MSEQFLKHIIRIGALRGDRLIDIPVLDDLPLLKPENVDVSASSASGLG